MRIAFTKMHGAGNDFALFEAPSGRWPSPATLRRLANRHTGIGFDQALLLEAPRRAGTVVFYRIFNSDGGEVEQCGNGARCIAAFLHRRGMSSARAVLDSPAGPIEARIDAAGRVSVDMGIPNFDPSSLPFEADSPAAAYSLEADGSPIEIGAVSMGNPHAVVEVTSVDRAPVESVGRAIEAHPRFPKRVNVGFVEVVDRSHVRLRVYERGAGETLACGTGACAAVAVERGRGRLDSSVKVGMRGGDLRVDWAGPGERIWLTGPAEVSFEGQVEVE